MRTNNITMSFGCCYPFLTRISIWIFFITYYYTNSEVTLSPSTDRVSVCSGDKLVLTCSSNSTFLIWIISDPQDLDPQTSRQLVSAPNTGTVQLPELIVDSVAYNVTAGLDPETSNLVSTLMVDNVTANLNDTVIDCTEPGSERSEMLNISIPGMDDEYVANVTTIQHHYMENSVEVILLLENSQLGTAVMYNTSIIPPTLFTNFIQENNTVQITNLTYNVPYYVSVNTSVCRKVSGTVFIPLFFTNCGHPLHGVSKSYLMLLDFNSSKVDQRPIIQGTNFTLGCFCGQELKSNYTITCLENGNWQPDPSQIDNCEDYDTCSNPMPKSEPDINIGTTLGATLGAIVAATIITVITILILCIIKKKGLNLVRMKTELLNTEQNYQETSDQAYSYPTLHLNHHLNQSEYSLLQHSPGPQNTDLKGAASCGETLVYADIGPSSLRAQASSTINLGDYKMEYAKINHEHDSCNNQASSALMKSSHAVEDVHPVDKLLDLDNLLIQLRGQVNHRWYQFGLAIGLSSKELNKFRECPTDQSIVEVLDFWIRNHPGQPTWREIAKGLKELHLQQLSLELEGVYETGTLPFEVKNQNVEKLLAPVEPRPPPLPPKMWSLACDEDSTLSVQEYKGQRSMLSTGPEASTPPIPPKFQPDINHGIDEAVPPIPPKDEAVPPIPPKPLK